MNSRNIQLQPYNTFSIACLAKRFYLIESLEDLHDFSTLNREAIADNRFYILGEGSNSLFVNDEVDLVFKTAIKGIQVQETEHHYQLTVGAGENWHQLVEYCLNNQMNGLENLALIPGSVGAAPVQNIGAYGVELAQFCHQVHWFNFASQQIEILSNQACKFAYRESVFKHDLKGKGLIAHVVFKLPKQWQPQISYQGLNSLPTPISAQAIFDKVIEIRQSKLPDPNILPNAGSFFKNPVVTRALSERLLEKYPKMPNYPQQNDEVKLAAGWLIEQAGLKGCQLGNVAVHENQALVLVNNKQGSGDDIIKLAKKVQTEVFAQFSILLEPEVRFINQLGECDALTLLSQTEVDI